jgi:hypothetical protein
MTDTTPAQPAPRWQAVPFGAPRRAPGSRLLPVLGGVWLALTVVPTALWLVLASVFSHVVFNGLCGPPVCTSPVNDRVGVAVPLLMTVSVAMLAAMIVVPHRGRLRWLRGAMLAMLVAASVAADVVVFSA